MSRAAREPRVSCRDAGRTAAPGTERSRQPDLKRFKPHRRRSDARVAVGEPLGSEPREM